MSKAADATFPLCPTSADTRRCTRAVPTTPRPMTTSSRHFSSRPCFAPPRALYKHCIIINRHGPRVHEPHICLFKSVVSTSFRYPRDELCYGRRVTMDWSGRAQTKLVLTIGRCSQIVRHITTRRFYSPCIPPTFFGGVGLVPTSVIPVL